MHRKYADELKTQFHKACIIIIMLRLFKCSNNSLLLSFVASFVLLLSLTTNANAACSNNNSTSCANGGVCQDSKCLCASGFWSDDCSKVCRIKCLNEGQCVSDADLHGGLEMEGTFSCDCPDTHAGPLCAYVITASGICALDSDCDNGGTCIISDEASSMVAGERGTCRCAPGYWGTICSRMCPIQCQNGGQCVLDSELHGGLEMEGDWYCQCPDAFRGPLCVTPSSSTPTATWETAPTPTKRPASSPVRPTSSGLQSITSPSPPADEKREFGVALGIAMGCTVVVALVLILIVTRIRKPAFSQEDVSHNDGETTTTTCPVVEDTDLSLQVEDQTIT